MVVQATMLSALKPRVGEAGSSAANPAAATPAAQAAKPVTPNKPRAQESAEAVEAADLAFVREEEKLARDVYAQMAGTEDTADAVIDRAQTLLVVTDDRGRMLRYNRACAELSGYSMQELAEPALWRKLVPLERLTAGPSGATGPAGAAPAPTPLRWRPMAAALAGYTLFGVGYIGYMTFVIALLREQGVGTAAVTGFYALLGLAVVASSRLWAGLLDRARGGQALARLNGLLGLATVLPALTGSAPVVLASGPWVSSISSMMPKEPCSARTNL